MNREKLSEKLDATKIDCKMVQYKSLLNLIHVNQHSLVSSFIVPKQIVYTYIHNIKKRIFQQNENVDL
jgi:hypothetical protein